MDTWEFLLQKKGDKSWLPLESPTVEILEGQYRLASRSDFANMVISIQMRYTPHSETNYRPTQQKISKRVNPEGLLIVIPYTHFTPGIWQINCSQERSPNLAKAQQETWSVKLQFDVLPISSDLSLDWQTPELPNLDEELLDSEPQQVEPSISLSQPKRVMELSEVFQTEQLPVNALSKNLEFAKSSRSFSEDEEAQELNVDSDYEDESSSFSNDISKSDWLEELPQNLLRLNQSQYLVARGEKIAIAGETFIPGGLEITLKNPQNLEILFTNRQVIAQPEPLVLPFPFSSEITLPEHLRSQVIIGEVRVTNEELELDLSDRITHQVITITYESGNLLAEISAEISQETLDLELSNFPTQEISQKPSTSTSAPLPIEKSGLPKLPPLPQLPFKPSLPKPPLAKPVASSTNSTASKSLSLPPKLPPLPSLYPLNTASENIDTAIDQETNLEIDSDSDLSVLENIIEQSQELASASDRFFLTNPSLSLSSLEMPDVDLSPSSSANQEEASKTELRYEFENDTPYEFAEPTKRLIPEEPLTLGQTLHQDNRFLQKLQTLSQENLSSETNSEADPGSSPQPRAELEIMALELEQMLIHDENFTEIEALWEAPDLEIGIDPATDELVKSIITKANLEQPQPVSTTPKIDSFDSGDEMAALPVQSPKVIAQSTLPAHEPIPLPILEIPALELVAGSSIPVIIKIPIIISKLSVKLWVKDCQTRVVIDGPRWLMDFNPTKEGEFKKAITQITLPLGSIEVAFEAIAVEMETQRESHKARVVCAVMPPNLSQAIEINFEDAWDS